MNPDCPATSPACEHNRATDYGNHGCRCPEARRAFFTARKKRHLAATRRLDATGTRRRLQALKTLGYSNSQLATEIGCTRSLPDKVLYRNQPHVTVRFAAAVLVAYDRLWDKPATGPQAPRLRVLAAQRGYVPPLWWDDDLIDDPNATTDYQPYRTWSAADRRASTTRTIAELTAEGLSASEIAARVGIAQRSVVRIRARLRAAEAQDVTGAPASLDGMQVAS